MARKSNGPLDVLSGARVQARILGALAIRDMMKRYGRANIGFLWVVLEPMILTAAVMTLWSFIKAPVEHGVTVISLVLTGYMPLTLFRHISGVGPHLLRQSVAFLYHRRITFIDVLLARTFLELAGTTTALLVVYGALLIVDLVSPMRDPGLCVAGWLTMAALSFGFAAIFAVLTEVSESTERFIPPIQYILLPISGSFFMVEWLPKAAQDVVVWVPMVHCYEMFRAGFLGEDVVTHFSPWYPLAWALALTAIGVYSIDRVRDKIHTG
ncbi:MAG: ABC transporter permease [Hyphomicrobium aestuarii]|nr:ABC transporter permease [Hyphomicrobium aestuarii]